MDLGIKNKTALVTGASRGLGGGICQSLAREGVNIVAVSRSKSELETCLSSLTQTKKEHEFFACDLSSDDGPQSLIDHLDKKSLVPDIIVNNVGGNLGFSDPLGSVKEWRQVMRLNVEVAIEINRAFIPVMREKKWGRICHISSISSLENQGPPSYCAAKSAINAYVRSLGRFVAQDNVILTSVMPGAVITEGGYWDIASKERPDHVANYLKERMAIHRFGRVDEVSELVAFLCSEHASFCVGSCFLVDGGQGRVFHMD